MLVSGTYIIICTCVCTYRFHKMNYEQTVELENAGSTLFDKFVQFNIRTCLSNYSRILGKSQCSWPSFSKAKLHFSKHNFGTQCIWTVNAIIQLNRLCSWHSFSRSNFWNFTVLCYNLNMAGCKGNGHMSNFSQVSMSVIYIFKVELLKFYCLYYKTITIKWLDLDAPFPAHVCMFTGCRVIKF